MDKNLASTKRQIHSSKKESTRSITYRLPEKLVTELETESAQKGISQNVLVRQILEKMRDTNAAHYYEFYIARRGY